MNTIALSEINLDAPTQLRFMENEFKLNRDAILEVVKCSRQQYDKETKEVRAVLEAYRNGTIRELAEAGKSQCEIAAVVGMSLSGVNKS